MKKSDFLRICRQVGRNPKEIKDPKRYMDAWNRTDERLKKP